MEKYLFYRMTYDSGFAPNPFGKYLTLATCTPNHRIGCSLKVGDYIVGVEAKGLAQKRKNVKYKTEINQSLIYIAKVSQILSLDEYFNTEKFNYKKVRFDRTWREKLGDNVYYIDKNDNHWKWIRNHEHDKKERKYFPVEELDNIYKNKDKNGYYEMAQDIKGDKVYISDEFLYLGDECVELEEEFLPLLPYRGYSINHAKELLEKFKTWHQKLLKTYGKGKIGNPILCNIYNNCVELSTTNNLSKYNESISFTNFYMKL